MNIAFVVYAVGVGGAERVSVTLAEYLQKVGHQVHILCYRNDNSYPVDGAIPLVCLPDAQNPVRKHWKRILFFQQYAKKNQIDAVIALFRGFDFTWVYRNLFHGCLILSQRNDPKAEYAHDRSARFQCKWFFNGADGIVFQTEEEMAYFSSAIQKKGTVIPNPIKSDLPVPSREKREKTIVNFCRLEPQKNLRLLIDAFGSVRVLYPEYRLKIFGEGHQREELSAYIKEKQMEEQIELLPFSKRIHEEIKHASMFVSSSDYEGISNSMLEAMAMELPCICTDCPAGGARMAIQDGENGLLVPVGDQNRLADAMISLIQDPEYAERLGKRAGEVRSRFSAEAVCREWDVLIRRTAEKRYKRGVNKNH